MYLPICPKLASVLPFLYSKHIKYHLSEYKLILRTIGFKVMGYNEKKHSNTNTQGANFSYRSFQLQLCKNKKCWGLLDVNKSKNL